MALILMISYLRLRIGFPLEGVEVVVMWVPQLHPAFGSRLVHRFGQGGPVYLASLLQLAPRPLRREENAAPRRQVALLPGLDPLPVGGLEQDHAFRQSGLLVLGWSLVRQSSCQLPWFRWRPAGWNR